MDDRAKTDEPDPKVLAELSALADGTLDPARAPAVRELIDRTPGLRERYEHERHAVRALVALRAERAPARLRARIEAGRRPARTRIGPRLRLGYGAAAGAVVAAAILAIVLLLPAGTPGSPSVSQAASLALRGPVSAAPPMGGAHPPATLALDVQEVYFPNWTRLFGWRATGERIDRLDGRPAVTVFYAWRGKSIAYTIVSAPSLRLPNARTYTLGGTRLQSFVMGDRQVVTWRRAGHTCVLSGVGVPGGELSKLAAWKVPGAAS